MCCEPCTDQREPWRTGEREPQALPGDADRAALIEEAVDFVRRSGAVFLRAELAPPWAVSSMGPREVAAALRVPAQRLVLFHVVLEGSCRVQVTSGEELVLGAGEAAVLPHGDRHVTSSPGAPAPSPVPQLVSPPPWRSLPFMRLGTGGRPTRMLSGYLHCRDLPFHPLLRPLPPLMRVRGKAGTTEWLRAAARYGLAEACRGGSSAARLPELLLADCLLQHLRRLPPAGPGWLAAVRDPVIARAMALLHQAPAARWTAGRLARHAGSSRPALRQGFTATLGVKPMQYLHEWRLQLAWHLLRRSSATLPEIADRTGLGSEAAFRGAFRRAMGMQPEECRPWPRPAQAVPLREREPGPAAPAGADTGRRPWRRAGRPAEGRDRATTPPPWPAR